MNWKTACHSSVGVANQKKRIPCQDYANYLLLNQEVIIGAVTDGAGSAKYAEIGAKLAVEETLKYLANNHQQFSRQSSPAMDNIAQQIFSNVVKTVNNVFITKAKQEKCSINDFACTIIVFIATPKWIAAMQIGDGFLVVRLENEKNYELVFQPDKGEYINETTFITSKNALDKMQIKVLSGNKKFICASTDGLEKVSINLSNWHPHSPFFKPLETYLEKTENPEQNQEYLQNFLYSERLNTRTDDDKTLLLCLYQ